MVVTVKLSCLANRCNCDCCSTMRRCRCYHCSTRGRRAPRPLAGNGVTPESDYGLIVITETFRLAIMLGAAPAPGVTIVAPS